MSQIRRFQIATGKHLVMPLGLLPAPGAKHTRLKDGAVFDLDFSKREVAVYQRFIANRVKVGDLVELEPGGPLPPAPPAEAAPASSAKPFEVNPPKGGK